MEQKRELSLSASGQQPQETKAQQLVDCLIKDDLVQDIKIGIISNLTDDEVNKAHTNTALTCSSLFSLFKPNFKSELITKLLGCMVWGQQDKAERLLNTSPELMLEKGSVTDCSGRVFSNISAFEFVLWALDTRYMINIMFDCLPKDDEKRIPLAAKLIMQYNHHKNHGVTYILEGQTITEKHFDFSVLIKALQTYIDNFDKWDWGPREAHWCKVVGMAQRYVPAHVMQHYCDPNIPFYPLPKFDAEQFIRTLKFYNYVNNPEMTWAGTTSLSVSVLGENFGIARGGRWGGAGDRGGAGR